VKENLAVHWNKIQRLLRKKKIYIRNEESGKQYKPDYKLKENDEIFYHESLILNEKKEDSEKYKQNNILYK